MRPLFYNLTGTRGNCAFLSYTIRTLIYAVIPEFFALPRNVQHKLLRNTQFRIPSSSYCYKLFPQTLVLMDLYTATRSEKYFKDPLEFKPEPWLRESKEVHSFSHLQFAFGPRMCLGKKIIMQFDCVNDL